MFTRSLVSLLLLCPFFSTAQITSGSDAYYLNKYRYERDKCVQACSPGGDVSKAEALLRSSYWQQQGIDYRLPELLLRYNVYGPSACTAYLNSLRQKNYSEEELAFAWAWVLQRTMHFAAFDSARSVFRDKFPSSVRDIDFDITELMQRYPDRYDSYSERWIAWQNALLLRIDSILLHTRPEPAQLNYYLTALLAMKFRNKEDDIARKAVKMWKEQQEWMSPAVMQRVLERADNTSYRSLIEEIGKQQQTTMTAQDKLRQQVFDAHEKFNGHGNGARLEKEMNTILGQATDALEKDQLKGLILALFDGDSNPKAGIRNTPFSAAFMQQLTPVSSDAVLLTGLKNLIAEETALTDDKKTFTGLKPDELHGQELLLATGIVLHARQARLHYSSDDLMGGILAGKQDKLHVSNWTECLAAFEKNPLRESTRQNWNFYYYPSLHTRAELEQVVQQLEPLIARYPGSVPLKEFQLICCLYDMNFNDGGNKTSVINFVFLHRLIDLYENSPEHDKKFDAPQGISVLLQCSNKEQKDFQKKFDMKERDIVQYFYAKLNATQQLRIIDQLQQAIAKFPRQNNLLSLQAWIDGKEK